MVDDHPNHIFSNNGGNGRKRDDKLEGPHTFGGTQPIEERWGNKKQKR